jgi:hypothetical protein
MIAHAICSKKKKKKKRNQVDNPFGPEFVRELVKLETHAH